MPRRLLIAVAAVVLTLATTASAAPTELSISDRLDDRRYVASGTRGYVVGVESGDFPALGWHTRGEMGGIWSPPLKLLDGAWFALDGEWLPPATRFTSGQGYVRMDYPVTAGLRVSRRDFVPDGRRAALIELSLRSTGGERSVDVWVDAHSELMSIYPWGETTPSQLDFNGQDSASFDSGELSFREAGKPWTAVVSSSPPPAAGETGPGFRGPHANPVVCGPSGPGQPAPPPRCQDSAYGKGAGGRLRYELTVPAGRERRLLIAVAGSDRGAAEARRELRVALDGADASFRAKVESRRKLERYTRLSLPGDPLLAQGIDWSKQNLADSVQVAEDLQVREVHAGKEYPAPSGGVQHVRFLGAGWPDYPWLFATDGEYTAFASVAVGQFEPIMDHLRGLRDVSRVANGDTGKVVHEVMTDGSVYFGANEDAGNTDETVKFPSAVALLWRWTGDDGFRDEMYDFTVDGMRWALSTLDADGDGWLEGPGNVEREGMGEEKLDVAVYTIRGLRDLADMARSRGDRATASWARERARDLERRFEAEWWMPDVPQHADSLDDPGNVKLQQRHWIGSVPMEAELVRGGRIVPGLATFPHGEAALALRETDCYSGDFGLFHTGVPGCDEAPDGPGEQQGLHAQHGDHGRRRGQLRASRPGPAGPLYRRQRSAAAAGAGRAAGRDARDRAVARLRALDRPAARRPRHGPAGVGRLRDGVAGRAPAAGRPPRPRPRPARGGPPGAGGPATRGRLEHPAGHGRLGRRERARVRLTPRDRGPRPGAAAPARARPHARARSERRSRPVGRRSGPLPRP